MDPEPSPAQVRRTVVRTERVRREVTVRFGATQAMRLGAKLIVRGLVAKVRRRPVQLTLKSGATRAPSVTILRGDEDAEPLAEPGSAKR